MTGKDFVAELLVMVNDFCRTLETQPPAYSYIPLTSDEERIRVMKSRLYNEVRAAELFGTWLKTTPELEVKAIMAESAHEEMEHAELLSRRITDLGFEPFDYQPFLLRRRCLMRSRDSPTHVNVWLDFHWPGKPWQLT